jgi:hypothetical protein
MYIQYMIIHVIIKFLECEYTVELGLATNYCIAIVAHTTWVRGVTGHLLLYKRRMGLQSAITRQACNLRNKYEIFISK